MVGNDNDDSIGESRAVWVPPLPPFSGPSAVTSGSLTTRGETRLGLLYVPPVRPTRSRSGAVAAHEGDASVATLEGNVHEAHNTAGDNSLAALTDVDYRGDAAPERSIDAVTEDQAEAIGASENGLLEAWTGSAAQLSPEAVESGREPSRGSSTSAAASQSHEGYSADAGAIQPPSRDEIESAMSTAAEAIGRLAEGMLAAPFMVSSDQPPMVGPEAAALAAAREFRRRETVAEVMEELAQRIREGEIPLSTLQEGAGDAVTLAEVLAAMLRNTR